MLRIDLYLFTLLLFIVLFSVSRVGFASSPVFFSNKQLVEAEASLRTANIDCICILALGSGGLAEAIRYAENYNLPIFTAFVSATTLHEARANHNKLTITGLFGDPDPVKQARLGQLLTGRSNVVLFYSDRSDYLKNQFHENQLIKTQKASIRNALSNLKRNTSVVVVPDKKIWNKQSFKIAALSLYRQNKILIGFSEKMVTSGAVASLYYKDSEYLEEFIALISSYASSDNLVPDPRYPIHYHI